jgi:hypothetical protein
VTATRSGPEEAVEEMMAMYRRLALMDPPALRALAGELERMSDESSASAALQASPPAQAKARREARRAAAARAALGSIDTEG